MSKSRMILSKALPIFQEPKFSFPTEQDAQQKEKKNVELIHVYKNKSLKKEIKLMIQVVNIIIEKQLKNY